MRCLLSHCFAVVLLFVATRGELTWEAGAISISLSRVFGCESEGGSDDRPPRRLGGCEADPTRFCSFLFPFLARFFLFFHATYRFPLPVFFFPLYLCCLWFLFSSACFARLFVISVYSLGCFCPPACLDLRSLYLQCVCCCLFLFHLFYLLSAVCCR